METCRFSILISYRLSFGREICQKMRHCPKIPAIYGNSTTVGGNAAGTSGGPGTDVGVAIASFAQVGPNSSKSWEPPKLKVTLVEPRL